MGNHFPKPWVRNGLRPQIFTPDGIHFGKKGFCRMQDMVKPDLVDGKDSPVGLEIASLSNFGA
jgi:hypothetical protein